MSTDAGLANPPGAPLHGRYFDGKTSRLHQVRLSVAHGEAIVEGDIERRCALKHLRVSEPMRHVARRVTFPDGAYLELADNSGINRLLTATGHQDHWVARLTQSWRGALAAGLAAVLALLLLYRFGLPAAASVLAQAMPASVEQTIGRETMKLLDARVLEPSKVAPARQAQIRQSFAYLRPPRSDAPAYEILFRGGRLGPNALALPSGQIILTDAMVAKMSGDDDALMGVLAHELGHLHEHHGMRQVIQGTLVGAAVTVLTGDVSTLVTTLSTAALSMRYSRDAERQADDYAIDMLKANGMPTESLARGFEKLEGDDKGGHFSYLSSHPSTAERIAHIRAAADR